MKITDFFLLLIKEIIKKIALLYSIISDFFFKIRNIKISKSYLMNGDLKSESTHILIYATYLAENKKNIINYHLNIFNSIFDEVVLINNSDDFKTAHKLTKDLKASVIINRYNSGRDIGAYKEGYSYIYNKIDSLASLKKITFINDSIIIVDRNLLDLFSKIELFGCSYHGSTYALSPYFHGQSFLFSFSINLFKRHEINEFFKYYRLVNSRHNAVYKGELGLFKAIQSTNCETIFNYDPLNIFTLKDNEYSSFIEKIPLNILKIIINNIYTDHKEQFNQTIDKKIKTIINNNIETELLAELKGMVIAYDLGLFLANAKKLPFIKFDLVRKNKADCFAYLSYLKETIDNESVFLTMQNELLKNGVYKDLRIIEKIKIHLGLS